MRLHGVERGSTFGRAIVLTVDYKHRHASLTFVREIELLVFELNAGRTWISDPTEFSIYFKEKNTSVNI